MKTCEKPVYVIAADGRQALKPGAREIAPEDFTFDDVSACDRQVYRQLDSALREAELGVKEGRYKTIIFDTISTYAQVVVSEELQLDNDKKQGSGGNNWNAWSVVRTRIDMPIKRLVSLNAHVIILSHYAEIKDDTGRKSVIPNIAGKAASSIMSLVDDIVFLDRGSNPGERVFVTAIDGCVLGPGGRNLRGLPTNQIPADVHKMWENYIQK